MFLGIKHVLRVIWRNIDMLRTVVHVVFLVCLFEKNKKSMYYPGKSSFLNTDDEIESLFSNPIEGMYSLGRLLAPPECEGTIIRKSLEALSRIVPHF